MRKKKYEVQILTERQYDHRAITDINKCFDGVEEDVASKFLSPLFATIATSRVLVNIEGSITVQKRLFRSA